MISSDQPCGHACGRGLRVTALEVAGCVLARGQAVSFVKWGWCPITIYGHGWRPGVCEFAALSLASTSGSSKLV